MKENFRAKAASLMIFTECLDQTEPCAATTAARLYFVARSPYVAANEGSTHDLCAETRPGPS